MSINVQTEKQDNSWVANAHCSLGAWHRRQLFMKAKGSSKVEALQLLQLKLLDEIDALTEAARQARKLAKEAEDE